MFTKSVVYSVIIGVSGIFAESYWVGAAETLGNRLTPPISDTAPSQSARMGVGNALTLVYDDGTTNAHGTWFGASIIRPLVGPQPVTVASAPSAVQFNNQIYVFVQGSDNGLWLKRYDGTAWRPWIAIGGDIQSTDAPSAIFFPRDGVFILFYRGIDDALWELCSGNGIDYYPCGPRDGLGIPSEDPLVTIASAPSALAFEGSIYVWVRGSDDRLWLKKFDGTSRIWRDWVSPRPDGSASSAPNVMSYLGCIDVLYKGWNGASWQLYDLSSCDHGATWGATFIAPPPAEVALNTAPSAVQFGINPPQWYVFVGALDNSLWLTRWDGVLQWTWTQLPGFTTIDAPGALVYPRDGLIVVFYRGSDDALWEMYTNNGSTFTLYGSHGIPGS